MNGKPPIPVSKTFLVCRQIFQDRRTGEYLLLGPTQDLIAPGFPAVLTLSIFSRWTSPHGVSKLVVQLHDLDGHRVGGQREESPLGLIDPLLTSIMVMHGL